MRLLPSDVEFDDTDSLKEMVIISKDLVLSSPEFLTPLLKNIILLHCLVIKN